MFSGPPVDFGVHMADLWRRLREKELEWSELLIVFCFLAFKCLFERIFPVGLSWTRGFLFEMFVIYLYIFLF